MQVLTVKVSGVLTQVEGAIWVETEEGARLRLMAGDRVEAGQQLHLADGAQMTLQQDDGAELAYASSPDLGATVAAQTAEMPTASDASEQALLQQAILQGLDPTQIFEASAAGAAPAAGAGVGDEGDAGYVAVSRTGGETLAEAGYDTLGTPGDTGPVPAEFDQLILEDDNNPPSAQPDQALLQEDVITTVSGSLLANDSDADGDLLAVTQVNGSAVTTVSGQFGVLTWSADGGFSYQLDNDLAQSMAQGETVSETFSYQISDGRGGFSTSTLTVTILGSNDAPTATANLNAVAEDGPLSSSGNLIGDDNGFGVDSDPDNGAQLSVSAVNGSNDQQIQGAFGTLVWNSDGSYSYNLDNSLAEVQGLSAGEFLTETFSYTLTDEFDVTSIATLTITINGTDDGVTIDGLALAGGELSLDEANLATGSNPDAAELVKGGSFDISAPDGLGDLTINGVTVIANGQYLGGTIQVIGQFGVLIITGFEGGQLQYSYELTSAADHSQGAVQDQFLVVLTDEDGSSANASLDVNILNDVPDVTLGGQEEVAELQSINGIWSLEAGADGAQLQVVFGGQGYALGQPIDTGFGTLTVFADGTWTFAANGNLDNSSQVALSFALQATDSDGDLASDSHVIRITDGANPTDADDLHLTVEETQIEDGASGDLFFTAGSDTLSNFHFMAPDSINIDVNGDNLADMTWEMSADGQTLTGYVGGQAAIVLNLSWSDIASGAMGNVTVTAQLLAAFPHPDGQGSNSIEVSGIVVGSDVDGDNVNGSVTVTIVDDVPMAVDDQTSQGAEDAPVLYNVLANDTLGADGATLTDAVVSSGLGSVQFNADGTVTYTPAAGEEGTVVINYTLTDGDGDTDQATLTIQLGPDSAPTLSAQDAVLDETGGLDSVNRSFTANYGNDSAGTVTLSAAGATWNAATQTLSADNGDWQIVVNNDGTYTVTQLQVMSHPDSSNPNDAIDVEVTMVVTDNEGDPADTTFTVSFLDDGPIAVDDQTSQGAEDAPVLYNVLANDTLGADGAILTDAVVSSGLGSVQFNADGTVTYTPAAGEEGTVIISYTLTDGDGDTDQATLTIQLGPDSTPTLSAQDAVLDETGGLDSVNRSFTASYGNDSAGTVTLSAAGATWNAATQTLSADNGDWQIVVNNDGTYTVTQLQVMNHPDSSNPNDAIDVEVTMVVTDNEGDPADTTFTVSFLDDGPVAVDDQTSQGAEDAPVVYNVLANDTLGADGATLTDAVVSSGLGSVQFNADGTVTYTPAAGEEGTVIISYTLTDGDGDTDQATLTIQLGPDSTPTLSAQDAVLDETGGLDSVNRSFTANYGNDSAGTVTLSAAGATWNAATQTLSADNGDWQIVVNNDGTYTVTQLQVMSHPDSSNPNDAIDVEVTMVVTDNEGDPADTTFTVSFLDDGPSLTADNLSIANLAGQYQGHYDFNIGADTQAFTASFDGNSLAWTNAPDGYELVFDAGASTANSLVFNGVFNDGADVFFTVQINQDGTYDFNLVTPEPVVEVPVGSLLSGISGGSGLSSYTFDDTQFGGYFDIVVTGTSQGNPATLTISSTDLGVNDNVMHGNKQDVLRFDVVQQVAGASLSQLTIDIAGTGGAKATDMVTYTVYYTDGSSQTVSEAIGSDFAVVIGTDTGRTVDYVELSPYDSAVSFKIDGLSANYVVTEYPDDYQLNFNLAGVDGDGDGASSGFSVNVTTSEGSGYELHGSDNADVLYGTAGNDMLYGGDGNDILAGGLGNDLLSGGQGADSFHWSQGETGTDTITDFSQGTDVLDLAELLVGEEGGSLESYLSFELIGGDTHILVDAQGDGSGTDQTIILQGVDLTSIGSDGDIIQSLLQSGSLLVDPATVTSTNVSPPPSPNGMESDSQLHVYL